jgi:hypothetical protein
VNVRTYRKAFLISAALLIVSFSAPAQNNQPAAAAPKADAKSQAFDPHDLSGIWMAHNAPRSNFSMGGTVPPMTEWAQARHDAARPGLGPRGAPLGDDPIMGCDPMGYPRIMFWTNYPIEILQIPGRTLMFFDWFYTYRTIWTDGRPLPADPDPRFYGTSTGKWDGDTFVIQSKGFDDRTWLDADGHPHSEDMTLEERFRRVSPDTIEYTMTITDPKAYKAPWVSAKMNMTRAEKGTGMREDICVPSVEAKYKEEVRNPAGGATHTK